VTFILKHSFRVSDIMVYMLGCQTCDCSVTSLGKLFTHTHTCRYHSSERCVRNCLHSLAVLCILSGEQAKNIHAQQIMSKVLDGATWINIHQLPVMLCFLSVVFVYGPCFMN